MIIGINGYKGTGKSTLAKFFHGVNIPFAGKLKEIAIEMGWNGKKDAKGRKLLQLLGTECGRKCIGEDIWVNHWIKTIETHKSFYKLITVDDLRFLNELEAIRQYIPHRLIKLKRTGYTSDGHPSEQDLPDDLFDFVYQNDGSLEDLQMFSKEIM